MIERKIREGAYAPDSPTSTSHVDSEMQSCTSDEPAPKELTVAVKQATLTPKNCFGERC